MSMRQGPGAASSSAACAGEATGPPPAPPWAHALGEGCQRPQESDAVLGFQHPEHEAQRKIAPAFRRLAQNLSSAWIVAAVEPKLGPAAGAPRRAFRYRPRA